MLLNVKVVKNDPIIINYPASLPNLQLVKSATPVDKAWPDGRVGFPHWHFLLAVVLKIAIIWLKRGLGLLKFMMDVSC